MGTSHFSCLDLGSRFWQIGMDGASEQCATFAVGNLVFFECDRMSFGLCNALATFQQLMQNCMGELDFIYCLICLDSLVVFSRVAGGHLCQLHVVFNCLGGCSLGLGPSRCSLFREEINCLACWVLGEGVQPGNSDVGAIVGCMPPQTCAEIGAFLGLMGHCGQFVKGFAQVAQLLCEHLAGGGPAEGLSRCHCQRGPLGLSKHWGRLAWMVQCWLLLIMLRISCWRQVPFGGIGGSSFPGAGGWAVLPSGLWWLGTCCTWGVAILWGWSFWHLGGPLWNISGNACCAGPSWSELTVIP